MWLRYTVTCQGATIHRNWTEVVIYLDSKGQINVELIQLNLTESFKLVLIITFSIPQHLRTWGRVWHWLRTGTDPGTGTGNLSTLTLLCPVGGIHGLRVTWTWGTLFLFAHKWLLDLQVWLVMWLRQIFSLVCLNTAFIWDDENQHEAILFGELLTRCRAAWGCSSPTAVDLTWTISSSA